MLGGRRGNGCCVGLKWFPPFSFPFLVESSGGRYGGGSWVGLDVSPLSGFFLAFLYQVWIECRMTGATAVLHRRERDVLVQQYNNELIDGGSSGMLCAWVSSCSVLERELRLTRAPPAPRKREGRNISDTSDIRVSFTMYAVQVYLRP